MPFDQTFFGKFHMWQSVLLLAIAAFPGWYLRATFFTIFLSCLMRDMEEFQFVRFILGLTALSKRPCAQQPAPHLPLQEPTRLKRAIPGAAPLAREERQPLAARTPKRGCGGPLWRLLLPSVTEVAALGHPRP